METAHFMVTSETGEYICDVDVPWEDLYWIKRTFLCSIQFGQIILH